MGVHIGSPAQLRGSVKVKLHGLSPSLNLRILSLSSSLLDTSQVTPSSQLLLPLEAGTFHPCSTLLQYLLMPTERPLPPRLSNLSSKTDSMEPTSIGSTLALSQERTKSRSPVRSSIPSLIMEVTVRVKSMHMASAQEVKMTAQIEPTLLSSFRSLEIKPVKTSKSPSPHLPHHGLSSTLMMSRPMMPLLTTGI